jgi:hypothetical protein
LEKPGVTDEQRREDCRACGGWCSFARKPDKPPKVCWSNPDDPSQCADYLDDMPYFSWEQIKAAGLSVERRNPRLYYRESLLLERWLQCMSSKGYVWNWNPLEPDK